MVQIGQKLQEERIKKGLTIEEVSRATKIRERFLSAIEKGEYHKLPSSAYAQGFVRNYAEFLGFPKREVMALFRREFDEEHVFKVLPEGLAKRDEFPLKRLQFTRTAAFLLLLFAGIFAYIAFQYRFAILNPPLTVDLPKEGERINQRMVNIVGKSDPNATIYIENEPIVMQKDGTFTKSIDVFEGTTSIRIKAVNRFGKETIIERKIRVESD